MALTYGFYDSVEGDERKYSAVQMSSIFDGIISDGIILNYKQSLQVKESNPKGMSVVVQPGRAWFEHTWTCNDSDLTLAVPQADTTNDRVDIVVLEVDNDKRVNTIKIVQGPADGSMRGPELVDTKNVHQHLLAGVWVGKNATSISNNDITYYAKKPTGQESYFPVYVTAPVTNGENLNAVTMSYSNSMSRMIDDLRTAVANAKGGGISDGSITSSKFAPSVKTELLDMVYPVGSIYMSANNTSPASLIGGTWVKIEGRFLLAANSKYPAGSEGGEETHTLTRAEMPRHEHGQYVAWSGGSTNANLDYDSWTSQATAVSQGINTGSAGGSEPHNNMPPYLAVYVWKRTA